MIHSLDAAEPVGPYPHARKAGGLLFLSGIGPRRRGGGPIPGTTLDDDGAVVDHDIAAQCVACFNNVRAVLDAAGSGWDRIVDVTVFLTDMADFEEMNRVWADHFTENRPTRTTVEISSLPTPIAIELKVIAELD